MKEDLSFFQNEENKRNNYDMSVASIGDVYRQLNLQKNYFHPGVTQPLAENPEKFREDKMKYLLQDKQKELIGKEDYSVNSDDKEVDNLIDFNINEKIKMDEYRNNASNYNEKLNEYPHIKNLYLDMASGKPDNNTEINVQYLKTTRNPQPKKYNHVRNGKINPVQSSYSIKSTTERNLKNHQDEIKEFVLEANPVQINIADVKRLKSQGKEMTNYQRPSTAYQQNNNQNANNYNYNYNYPNQTTNGFDINSVNVIENLEDCIVIDGADNYATNNSNFKGKSVIKNKTKRPNSSYRSSTTNFNKSNINTITNYNEDLNNHIEDTNAFNNTNQQNNYPSTAQFYPGNTNQYDQTQANNLSQTNFNNAKQNSTANNFQSSNQSMISNQSATKNFTLGNNKKIQKSKKPTKISENKLKESSKETRNLLKKVEEFYANTKNLLISSDNNLPGKVSLKQLEKHSGEIEENLDNFKKKVIDAPDINSMNSSVLSKQNKNNKQGNFMLKNSLNKYKKRGPKNFRINLPPEERKKFEEKLTLLHVEMRNTMDNLNEINNSSDKFQELTQRWQELTQTLKSLNANLEASNSNNFDTQKDNNQESYYPDVNYNQNNVNEASGSNFYNTQNQINNENYNYNEQNFNSTQGGNNQQNNVNFNATNNSNVFNNNLYNNQSNPQGYFEEVNNENFNQTNSNNFNNTNNNQFGNNTQQGNNNTNNLFNSTNRNFKQSNLSYNNEANSSKYGNLRTNENISSSLSNFNTNNNHKNSSLTSNKNFKENAQNYEGDMDEVINVLNPQNMRTNIFANQNETIYNNTNLNYQRNTNTKGIYGQNSSDNYYGNNNKINSNDGKFYQSQNSNFNNTNQNFYESDLKKQINNQNNNNNIYNSISSNVNPLKTTQAKSSIFSNNFSPFNSGSQINFSNNINDRNIYQQNNNQNTNINQQGIPEASPQDETVINPENPNSISQKNLPEKDRFNKEMDENLIDDLVTEYKDKLILNDKNVLQDGRYASYDIKMPLEYYHKYAKENEPPKDKDWYIRSHHTESKVKNSEVIPDDIMNTKYISYYGEPEKPPESPSRLNIINELLKGLNENVEGLKMKMHTKALTDKDFRVTYNSLLSLKEQAKLEFVPGKVFEKNEPKSPRSTEMLSGKNTGQKDYSEFFNQNEEIGKTNYIIKSYEALLLELRLKEKEKILEKRKEEYEKIRPPREKWYEMKSKNFQSEMRRNNKVLNSPPEYFEKLKLLQSKNLY